MKLLDSIVISIVISTIFATSLACGWLFYGLLEIPGIVAIWLAEVTGPTVFISELLIATK